MIKIVKYKDHYPISLLKELTSLTIPYGKESLMYPILIKHCKSSLSRDGFGNLFTKIGDSKILFTAHLDTYSSEVHEVNHKIKGGFLKTDGKTILGGDNKVGVAILINMINSGVPGNYYFYCGEEVGRLGSEYHNSKIEDGDFDLAITFDRKEIGSVCTHQRGIKLCSDELSDFIVTEFSNKTGYKFFKDLFGLSCDTFSFHKKVNNCLNLSTGVYDEHKTTERVNIDYYLKLFQSAPLIDWKKIESLSGSRVREKLDISSVSQDPVINSIISYFIENGYNPTKVPKYGEQFGIYTSDLYFKKIPKIFDYFYVSISNSGGVTIDEMEMPKEEVLKYIKSYKSLLQEFNFGGNKYHIMGISREDIEYTIEVLVNNKDLFDIKLDDKFQFILGDFEIEEEIKNWIVKVFKGSNISNFFQRFSK